MAVHNERPFEDAVCAHLAANGWLYSPTDNGYDVERALFPEDVFAWLADSQPAEYARLADVAPLNKDPHEHLLDTLVKRLDRPRSADGGTLGVLRKDHRMTGRGATLRVSLCQFEPNQTVNPDLLAMHDKVRLRVMRQVHYSKHNRKSIDLVLFVNGLPVATVELKSDYTQSVRHAIDQYRTDRKPGTGRTLEPLLQAGARALVHFAASHDEVHMATRLDGEDTIFLPFNRGHDGEPGNPLNPDGHATAYLWENILDRSTWLKILGSFMHSEPLPAAENMKAATSPGAKVLFPRFHQWEVVSQIVDEVRRNGVGNKFLVQHSAGSGKTNSIAWTAHELASLHGSDNKPVYSSVVVLTDRRVLNKQLQRAIKEIDQSGISVTPINEQEAQKRGKPSKSALLADAIRGGHRIIVTTIQTFPHALDLMGAQGDRRFAVLIDEAHQSQDGESGRKVDEALGAAPSDSADLDADGLIEEQMRKRALSPHMTFVAFTATPKSSTLELFGTPDSDTGVKRPFHLYSMRQAITEGFILDVLRNYRPVDVAAQIEEGQRPGMTPFDQRLVDGRQARSDLNRMIYEHPDVIDEKARYVVEHFTGRVSPLLAGRAKAMVVCYSRLAAVRFYRAIQRHANAAGVDLKPVVAFSGGVDGHTEAALNGFPEDPDIVFKREDSRRLLIVANKYQIGFDEPLLSAMYVDKPVSGINAVQTLSRLNRTLPAAGKNTTFVVDFTNGGEQILAAFKTYYKEARLQGEADPDQVHDLRNTLDDMGLYDNQDVLDVARAVAAKDQAAMDAVVGRVKRGYDARLAAAREHDDLDEATSLNNFVANLTNFIDAYAFLSQVYDYAEADLERRFVLYRLLAKRLGGDGNPRADLSGIKIDVLDLIEGDQSDLALDAEGNPIAPPDYTVVEGAAEDPIEETLRDIIDEFNARVMDRLGVDPDVAMPWVEALVDRILKDQTLVDQARANPADDFTDSLALQQAIAAAIRSVDGDLTTLTGAFHDDRATRQAITEAIGRVAHVYVTQPGSGKRRKDGPALG